MSRIGRRNAGPHLLIICRALLALALLLVTALPPAARSQELQTASPSGADASLHHADTFLRYATLRNASTTELRRAADYARRALEQAESATGPEGLLVRERAREFIRQREQEIKAVEGNLSNRLPAYLELVGERPEVALHLPPDRLAVRHALQPLLTHRVHSQQASTLRLPALVMVYPQPGEAVDSGLAQFAAQLVRAGSDHDVLAADMVGPGWARLYDLLDPRVASQHPRELDELPGQLGSAGFVIYTVWKSDAVEDLHRYAGALLVRSPDRTTVFQARSDAVVLDRTAHPWRRALLIGLVLALCMLFPVGLRVLIARKPRHSPVPAWWSALLAAAVGFAAALACIGLLRQIAPAAEIPLHHPAAWLWQVGCALALSLVPLLACFGLVAWVSGLRPLLQHEALRAPLVFGALVCGPALVGDAAMLRFGAASVMPSLAWILLLIPVSWFVAAAVETARGQLGSTGWIRSAVMLAACAALPLTLLRYWDWGGCLAGLALAAGAVGLQALVPARRPRGSGQQTEAESPESAMDSLRGELVAPSRYFERPGGLLRRALTHLSTPGWRIRAMRIVGAQGSGKTRFAMELAGRLEQDDPSTTVLVGDCSESREASEVPFEMYTRALASHSPANASADSADAQGPSLNQMALRVQEFVASRAAEGPVVLILDDTQWLDEDTQQLTIRLLNHFARDFEYPGRLSILIASRPVPGGSRVMDRVRELAERDRLLLEVVRDADLAHQGFADQLLESLRFDGEARRRVLRLFHSGAATTPLNVLQTLRTMVESGWCEARHGRIALRRDADLEGLPPPHHLDDMIRVQLEGLGDRLLTTLGCAACIGRQFRAGAVADALGWDRLEVLIRLREAERRRIVIDVEDQDDVFAFATRAVVAVLKTYFGQRGDAGRAPSEIVKEYNRRIVRGSERTRERAGIQLEDMDLGELCALARRVALIATSDPERALSYNLAAAGRCRRAGRLADAGWHYGVAHSVLKSRRAAGDGTRAAEVAVELAQLYLDRGLHDPTDDGTAGDCNARTWIDAAKGTLAEGDGTLPAELGAELTLLESLYHYRRRPQDLPRARELAHAVVVDAGAHPVQRLRGRFYETAFSETASRDQALGAVAELRSVLSDLEEVETSDSRAGSQMECAQLHAEIVNTMGIRYALATPRPEPLPEDDLDQARSLFEERLGMEGRTLHGGETFEDPKGLSIATGALGHLLWRNGQMDDALSYFQRVLQISRGLDDHHGVIVATEYMGHIHRRLADPAQAARSYDASLREAVLSGDLEGRLRAISGRIGASIDAGNDGQLRYGCGLLAEALDAGSQVLAQLSEQVFRELESELGRTELAAASALTHRVGAYVQSE